MKKTTKRAAMREVFATWKSSGLSLKAFGEGEGIAYAKLLYWRKRLSDEPSFAPVRIVDASPEVTAPRAEVVSIWLANGVSLEVPSTVAEGDLARMVRVLGAC
jgi:hypothetical protein